MQKMIRNQSKNKRLQNL